MHRLLLVEDDATSRAFLAAAGEALPATVDTAGTVREACAIATARHHDLWLFDAHLPDGSGAALLALLRAQGLQTPALAHTATSDRDELHALREAGFLAVVGKPLSADAWRGALRDALAGQRGAAPTADAPVAAGDAPLWDDAAALSAMNGNRGHVEALRDLFRAELPAMAETIAAASAAADHVALQSTLHKLRASCGFVGAAHLEAAARRLQAAPGSATAASALQAALQDTLSS
jgi:CheY-like chemotaxis protein